MKTPLLRHLITAALLLTLSAPAFAGTVRTSRPDWTRRSYLMINYNMGMPMGATYDFAGAFSFVGFNGEYRFRLANQLSLGAVIGYQNFENKVAGSYDMDNTTVTGNQIRRLETMPLLATLHFYLTGKKTIVPYLGGGMGGYFVKRQTNYAWWTETETTWHFGLFPELGIIATPKRVPLHISTRFNYMFPTRETRSEFFWGFTLGVAFAL